MPEQEPRHVALVANPYSGSRRNRELVEALIQELRLADLMPVPMWGREELKNAAASPDFARKFRCVVAAGGDGTLHHVINTQRSVPVTMFPLGTENLFAVHFGHARDPARMVQIIAGGRVKAVDLGRVGERYFSIVAGAGFDAEVIRRLHRWRTRRPDKLRRVNRLSYLRPMTWAFLGYRFPRFEVEADGRKLSGAMCMVFNLPRYGLGFNICTGAVCDDGMLDYVVFGKGGRLALASCALAVKRGTHLNRPDIHTGRAKLIRITGPRPVPLELDGEEAGFTPIEIAVAPKALRVMVLPDGSTP